MHGYDVLQQLHSRHCLLHPFAPAATPHLDRPNRPPAGCETEGARLLRAICARLPDPAAIPALFDALAGTGNASVSTFELLSSGCVRALKSYLQVGRRGGGVGSKGASGWSSRWQAQGSCFKDEWAAALDCVILPATWFSLRGACCFLPHRVLTCRLMRQIASRSCWTDWASLQVGGRVHKHGGCTDTRLAV